MQLARVHGRIRTDPSGPEALLTEASDGLARSLTELRELTAGIHPSALDHGLDIALDDLAVRSAVPTTVTVQPGPRLPEPVAFAAYCVTSEALANITKHPHADSASVRVAHAGERSRRGHNRAAGTTAGRADLPLVHRYLMTDALIRGQRSNGRRT